MGSPLLMRDIEFEKKSTNLVARDLTWVYSDLRQPRLVGRGGGFIALEALTENLVRGDESIGDSKV